jgi:hypothetical protein
VAVSDKAKAKPTPPAGGGTAAPADGAVTRIRGQLDEIRASLAQIERELAGLEEQPPVPRARRIRSERYYEVLIEVYERGPHGVSASELDELAALHGYDRRGMNGYFAGVRSPLRAHAGRIHLTLEGRRLVHEQLARKAGE